MMMMIMIIIIIIILLLLLLINIIIVIINIIIICYYLVAIFVSISTQKKWEILTYIRAFWYYGVLFLLLFPFLFNILYHICLNLFLCRHLNISWFLLFSSCPVDLYVIILSFSSSYIYYWSYLPWKIFLINFHFIWGTSSRSFKF